MEGVHELLASLGLDLAEVGPLAVTLRAGRTASRRLASSVLQALLALFGKYNFSFSDIKSGRRH